jgi:hypothetical protein
MKRLTVLFATILATILVAAVGGTAGAAGPTIERIPLSFSFEDEGLGEACGFPVSVTGEGRLIVRTFDRTAGPVQLVTINLALVYEANGREYRIRDVGGDLTRVAPDGTELLLVFGQVPFQFTGALKVNLTTGEVILTPQHTRENEHEEICAALAP